MKTEIKKILNLKQFFKITNENDHTIMYSLEKSSRILMQNIHSNWLNSIFSKTQKSIPVFLKNHVEFNKQDKIPFGFIKQSKPDTSQNEVSVGSIAPKIESMLNFNLLVPEQDTMQYFVQWQRYRKYWWSSITTTPSLFSVDDINHGDNRADVNIIAKFPFGQENVETINVNSKIEALKSMSQLSCTISLENALFILLLDGLTSQAKEGYLRLHRKMTPYKLSFALEKDSENKNTLKELANLLHSRLCTRKISTWLPDFSSDIETQLKENLEMGVVYTAILSDKTLSDGIFKLLSSSTMLNEQIHIADFDSYAALICGK